MKRRVPSGEKLTGGDARPEGSILRRGRSAVSLAWSAGSDRTGVVHAVLTPENRPPEMWQVSVFCRRSEDERMVD